MEEKMEKLKEGERAAGISTVVIFLLSLAEALVGFLSGSAILITDALHNTADSITTFASWFGLKISQRKPDQKFPYGYFKIENLTTLFVSGFILYAAFELLLEGYSKLLSSSELVMPFQALGMALVSAIASFFMARYMKKVGNEVNSQSLIASSQERTTHIFSSAIIFVAILLTLYRIPYVEGIIIMFFSLIVLRIGIFTAKDSILALMDVTPSKQIEEGIKTILDSIAGIEGFENLKLRKAGPFMFGEVVVKIRKFVDVRRAHEISENIENKIKEEMRRVNSFTIHVEPYETQKQTLAIPIKRDKGLDSEIMGHFGRANYFLFVTIDKKKGAVESTYVKENPYKEKTVRAGFSASEFIVKKKIDALVTREIGGISFHTLRDHLVDIYKVKGKNVREAVDNFVNNGLERLTKPTREEVPPIKEKTS